MYFLPVQVEIIVEILVLGENEPLVLARVEQSHLLVINLRHHAKAVDGLLF